MDALYLPGFDAFLRYVHLPGRQPPLVYLTGLGLAVAGTYSHCIVAPPLREHRSVLVDVLGAGFSDGPETFSYTLEEHARTVATLLDHLGLTDATVLGYSFGGSVAITLAAIRPGLVGSLVLMEPNLHPGGGFLSRRIAGQSEERFRTAGFAEVVAEALAKGRAGSRPWAATSGMLRIASPHGLYRSAVSLVEGTRPTMRERLLALPIPRALIRGEANGPHRREHELRAAGIELHVVPRAGHGMMWENPAGLVGAVKAAVVTQVARAPV